MRLLDATWQDQYLPGLECEGVEFGGLPFQGRPNSKQPISEPHELEQFKRSEPKLCFLVVENRQTQTLIVLKSGL
jgi:hypothetical protein